MGLILVTGAGGFLGGHLIRRLLERGFAVRAVDCKPFENWTFHSSDGRIWCMTFRKRTLAIEL